MVPVLTDSSAGTYSPFLNLILTRIKLFNTDKLS
jgi:hypothetical protein